MNLIEVVDLNTGQVRRVVDLCSGGGGPWLVLHRRVGEGSAEPLSITLTDLHPNVTAYAFARERTDGIVTGREEAVDATRVPTELEGIRTLFGSFHHFRPEMARAILQDAVAHRRGVGIFDGSREWRMLLVMPFVLLAVPLSVPFIRPFRWTRLFWTYLIPLLPLVAVFDAIVSCLRCNTMRELQALTEQLEGDPYEWEIGRRRGRWAPFHVTYLVGWPKE